MKITFWDSLFIKSGKQRDLTWDRLVEWLNAPRDFVPPIQAEDKHIIEPGTPGWSAAEFVGSTRKKELVVTVSALVLDFDGTVDRQTVEKLFDGYKYVAHSSKSNTDETPSYRVVVALSKPVPAQEYALLWSGFSRKLSEYVDQAPKDGSRFWFAPCKLETTKWEHWERTGEPIGVDSVIAEERKRQAIEFKERETIHVSRNQDTSVLAQRCKKYVDRMDAAVSGQHGHTQTLKVALVIYRGFSLPDSEAWEAMNDYNQRCSPPWSKKDLERKASEAKKSKLVSDGWLLADTPQNTFERKKAETVEWQQNDDSFYDSLPDTFEPSPATDQSIVPIGDPLPKTELVKKEPPKSVAERYGIISVQEMLMQAYRYLTDDRPKSRATTGIREVDEVLGNLGRGMVTTFGAPTNWGKTALSVMSGLCSKSAGCDVLYFSYEDVPLLFGRRILAKHAEINATCIRDKDINTEEWKRITRAIAESPDDPFFVNCIGKSIEYGARIIGDFAAEREANGKTNELVVIIDYLQRIKTDMRTQDRRNQVSYVMAEASDAIKKVDACGLVLSQIKRLETDEEPDLSSLKESGDIECFTDNVVLGWKRSGQQHTERVVAVKKNKDGPLLLDPVVVEFDPITASFIASIEAGFTSDERRFRRDLDNQFADAF